MGTISQDGGCLMDTTSDTVADKKQDQFVTKSQIPGALPHPRLPLCLALCCSQCPSPDSKTLVFPPEAGADRLCQSGLRNQKVLVVFQNSMAAGKRSWLGSPSLLWTMKGVLFPHSLLPMEVQCR